MYDSIGSFLSGLEWNALYGLVAKDGLMAKDDIRGMYDGTLFYQRAQQLEQQSSAGD